MFSARSTFIALSLSLAAFVASAQTVPPNINYQGRLTDNTPTHTPINATVLMSFEIWDLAAGGTPGVNRLWVEPASGTTSVVVTNGIFNVLLGGNGTQLPASLFSGGTNRYLQIIADGEILAPRQPLSATGYANQAQNAALAVDSGRLGGVIASGWQRSLSAPTCAAGQFFNSIAPGGAASCAPPPAATLTPPVSLSAGSASPILAASNSSSGPGLYGASTGGNGIVGSGLTGVVGNSAVTNGRGVLGEADNGVNAFGVQGYSANGYGVVGNGLAAGVYGANLGSGPAGLFQGNVTITATGTANRFGIGTSNPSQDLAFGGQVARTVWLERNNTGGGGGDLKLQAGGAAAASTDQQGGDVILAGGIGTGLGGGGNVRILAAGATGASGTTDGVLNDRYIIVGKGKAMTLGSPGFTSLASFQVLPSEVAGGRVHYTIVATDGGSQIATEEGVIQYLATTNSITCTVQTTDKLHLGTVNSGCTPGFFNPGSQPGISIFDNVTFSSPAPIVKHIVYFQIENATGAPVRLEP